MTATDATPSTSHRGRLPLSKPQRAWHDGPMVLVILTPDARYTGFQLRSHGPRVPQIKAAVRDAIRDAGR